MQDTTARWTLSIPKKRRAGSNLGGRIFKIDHELYLLISGRLMEKQPLFPTFPGHGFLRNSSNVRDYDLDVKFPVRALPDKVTI